jgi:IS30 family transposase
MEHIQKGRDNWHHFTQSDRDRMETLLNHGVKQVDIAGILSVDPSTISRERKRQRKDGRYEATTAHHKARVKRSLSKYQGMKVESNVELKAHIIRGLQEKRSPDEIAGRMKRDSEPLCASKNAIYHWLYSVWGERYCHFLCTKRRSRKRQTKKLGRVMIPNRVSIAKRPLGATNKTRYGHCEGDTIVAPKRAHNTESVAIAIERKTKLVVGTKIPSLSPRNMTSAMTQLTETIRMKSITMDNGIENRDHESWSILAYFADPHSPWQKPMIENVIGLLRRWFFRKGTDWNLVREKQLQEAFTILNHKYRKSLNYQSATEVAVAHGMMKQTKIPRRGNCN